MLCPVLHPVGQYCGAASQVIRAQPRPILIYQMGKVGSTAVCQALNAEGLEPLHIHFLGRKAVIARANYRNRDSLLPSHFYVERILQVYLRVTRHRLKVITLVRDPIARFISSAYQTRNRDRYETDNVDTMVERLISELSDSKALDYCYTWFDDEIREVFGVDLLSHHFDQRKGFAEIAGPRVDVLVLKLENLASLWPEIGAFVGRSVSPAQANIRTGESSGKTYDAVRVSLHLRREQVEDLYDHPWMRHFYSEAEVAQFIERWSV